MNTSLAGKKLDKDAIKEILNFNHYDLRGTDFSEVNVSGVKFSGALLGRSLITTRWLLLLQSVLLMAASYFVVYGNAFAAWFIEVQLKAFDIYSSFNLFFILVVYALGFVCAMFYSLKSKNWSLPVFFTIVLILAALAAVQAEKVVEAKAARVEAATKARVITNNGTDTEDKTGDKTGAGARAVDGPAAIAGAIVGAGLGTILVLVVVATIVTGSGADTRVRNLFATVSVVGAGISILGFTQSIGDSIAKAGFEKLDEAREIAETIAFSGAGAGLVFILFSVYLGCRAIRDEEPEFLFLRHFGIELNSFRGTEFSGATLHDCNFSGVDLKHVRFKNVKLRGCNFLNSKNMHLASTRGTSIELKKVRDLVVKAVAVDPLNIGAFLGSNLDLQGLDFSNQNFLNANLSNANLSFANFTDCDFRNADLSEVNAIGANFTRCKLKGACIQNWNIDVRTRLDGVECDFVYTKLSTKERDLGTGKFKRFIPDPTNKNDKCETNPPDGKFGVGDFTTIYKELAETIDVIVENKSELNALMKAIENINIEANSEKVTVQEIKFNKEDRKIVVKLEALPEFDYEQIYIEVKEGKDKIIRLEKELEVRQIELDSQKIHTQSFLHDIGHKVKSVKYALTDPHNTISLENIQNSIDDAVINSEAAFNLIREAKTSILKPFSDKFEYSNIDVHLLAEEVIKENRSIANQKKVKLYLSKKCDVKTIGRSDRHYLKRILDNLVSNGIKYADASKGETAIVAIAIISHAQTVRIDIIDNGIGIPPSEQDNIWMEGVQLNNPEKNSEKGSGMGLYFVRSTMLALLNHRITLKNPNPKVGTRFCLWLPKGDMFDESINPDYPLQRLYVLLVEHNDLVKKSLTVLLEKNGALCDSVGTMEELNKLLPTDRWPDAVVTEYSLPDGSAVDVLAALKLAFPCEIPTLIIADENANPSIELQAKELILHKPIEYPQLLTLINRLGRE